MGLNFYVACGVLKYKYETILDVSPIKGKIYPKIEIPK